MSAVRDGGKAPEHILQRMEFMFSGDRLKICVNKKGQRPVEFSSAQGSDNSLFVLKRAASGDNR